ncbi:MAG: DUF4129 domain-containing protein [Planctomycetes bacterium]|nr:DUF4129 domain-containing protein [Planctomycetota bacterium]
MAAEREPPSVADYVVTALSPALVMLMVGSLVFFLVEVLYAGKYSDRLLYTFFFFVLAAVLVARISIQYDAGRAAVYGVALAVVTYIALLSYVDYPQGWLRSWGWLVNLGLLAVVWWSAHKLTWDCTHIDEKRESSGRGLLSAAGLDADDKQAPEPANPDGKAGGEPAPRANPERKRRGKKKKKAEPDSRLWAWIERYKAHREAERKGGHTPGVWVLYFALAALPLFALGQSLVDPDDDKRRTATFLQMTVYVASALGLLVTTSLLGVRRYLRQRKAKVPAVMTASWLGLGAVTIVAFVLLGAFLPRPHSEVPWFGIERAGKEKRQASRYAQNSGGSTGEGEGRGGGQSRAGDGTASGKGGQPGGGSGGEKGGGRGQGGKGGSGKTGDQSGGDQKGGGKGNGGESEARKDQDGERRGGGSDNDTEEAKDDGGSRSGGSDSTTQLGGALAKVAGAVKWIVFAILAVLIVFGLFFGVLKYLAPFTDWARRWLDGIRAWWASLFGGAKANPDRKAGDEARPQGPVRPPPFSEYSNPFADGSAERREPAELIAYTFEALDAWAWDRDAGREPTETALEFAARLGEAFPDHAAAFTKLAILCTRMAYSELPIPDTAIAALEDAWEHMVHGAPVGA